MTLDIKSKETKFYSYLRHSGDKQDLAETQISGNTIIASKNATFGDKESECVVINLTQKYFRVYDKKSRIPHYYEDSLIMPTWLLLPDTTTILNEVCQKATALFRGRNIIAWFAKNIPLQYGPWLYVGLPGLIMKVEDTRNQFSFISRELITKPETEPVFLEYDNVEKVSKDIAIKRKRLYYEDFIAFSAQEWGVTMTYPGFDANKPRKKKPYNPLDLSH
jgi:GLPGLI family protein